MFLISRLLILCICFNVVCFNYVKLFVLLSWDSLAKEIQNLTGNIPGKLKVN